AAHFSSTYLFAAASQRHDFLKGTSCVRAPTVFVPEKPKRERSFSAETVPSEYSTVPPRPSSSPTDSPIWSDSSSAILPDVAIARTEIAWVGQAPQVPVPRRENVPSSPRPQSPRRRRRSRSRPSQRGPPWRTASRDRRLGLPRRDQRGRRGPFAEVAVDRE